MKTIYYEHFGIGDVASTTTQGIGGLTGAIGLPSSPADLLKFMFGGGSYGTFILIGIIVFVIVLVIFLIK